MMSLSNLSNTAGDITEKSMGDLLQHLFAEKSFSLRPVTLPIADWQLKQYFGWTDDMIALRHKVKV
jgi:hypothetical protein